MIFGFIGGNNTPLSIGFEITVWGVIGVISRTAYLKSQVIKRGEEFSFLSSLIEWIGTSLLAIGILTAVIFSLSIVSLNVAGVEITLADAPIEAIIAISFILSFYYEETQKLLGSLSERIFYSKESSSEQQSL